MVLFGWHTHNEGEISEIMAMVVVTRKSIGVVMLELCVWICVLFGFCVLLRLLVARTSKFCCRSMRVMSGCQKSQNALEIKIVGDIDIML